MKIRDSRKLIITICLFIALSCLTAIAFTEDHNEKDKTTIKEIVIADTENNTKVSQESSNLMDDVAKGNMAKEEVLKIDNNLSELTFTIEASSIFSEKVNNNTIIYTPLALCDSDFTTVWVEGADGDGVGEWITIDNEQQFDLDTIQLTNGFTKNEDLYYKNNRIARLEIIATNGESKEIYLLDGILGLQEFDVGFKNITGIKIIIKEVFKGTRHNDLCMSEIRFNKYPLSAILSDANQVKIQHMTKVGF
ncbi:NADase-type glycan-binding domain-containing protein [Cellulosilyticum sp. I15G10I2]|uniref:NADase-type glycan-binding domain-containing protein n=1 Tax=Cellulosilyticum sp. I15G10I2 TaxID=1892843 RepID=UPI00085C1A4C|nr:hypothetical protein [Cellulosilyticum sp. I15G10I2]